MLESLACSYTAFPLLPSHQFFDGASTSKIISQIQAVRGILNAFFALILYIET